MYLEIMLGRDGCGANPTVLLKNALRPSIIPFTISNT